MLKKKSECNGNNVDCPYRNGQMFYNAKVFLDETQEEER